MSLIGLLVVLVIIGLLWWALNAIMGAFGLGDPIATIVRVVFVVVVILYLLSAFVLGTGPHLRVT